MISVSTIGPPDDHEALEQARQLAVRMSEHVTSMEDEQHVPLDIVHRITASGLLRWFVPPAFEGSGGSFRTYHDIVQILARQDVSLAWCLAHTLLFAWIIAQGPQRLQHEVWFDNPNVFFTGSFDPVGQVREVDDGYELSGSWEAVSWVEGTQWALLAGQITQHLVPALFVVPRRAFRAVDSGLYLGPHASGQKRLVLTHTLVPHYRVISLAELCKGNLPARYPLFAVRFLALVTPALGAAWGAYDTVTSEMLPKQKHCLERPEVQEDLTQVYSHLRCATLLHQALLQDIEAQTHGLDLEQRIRMRQDCCTIVSFCFQAIDLLRILIADQGVQGKQRLQRTWHDLRMIAIFHELQPEMTARLFGQWALGLPLTLDHHAF